MSRKSRLSANCKDANEVNPGPMQRSPDIYLTTVMNPRKPQLGDRLAKDMRQVIASNEVSRIALPVREEEERKERSKGRSYNICIITVSFYKQ